MMGWDLVEMTDERMSELPPLETERTRLNQNNRLSDTDSTRLGRSEDSLGKDHGHELRQILATLLTRGLHLPKGMEWKPPRCENIGCHHGLPKLIRMPKQIAHCLREQWTTQGKMVKWSLKLNRTQSVDESVFSLFEEEGVEHDVVADL